MENMMRQIYNGRWSTRRNMLLAYCRLKLRMDRRMMEVGTMLSDYEKSNGWIEWAEQAAPIGVVVEGFFEDGECGYQEDIYWAESGEIVSKKYGGEKVRPPFMWRYLKN
jgi:hypothetical protein